MDFNKKQMQSLAELRKTRIAEVREQYKRDKSDLGAILEYMVALGVSPNVAAPLALEWRKEVAAR